MATKIVYGMSNVSSRDFAMPVLETTTDVEPRPGERVQTWWCEECEEWHTGSVLGGPIDDKESK